MVTNFKTIVLYTFLSILLIKSGFIIGILTRNFNLIEIAGRSKQPLFRSTCHLYAADIVPLPLKVGSPINVLERETRVVGTV